MSSFYEDGGNNGNSNQRLNLKDTRSFAILTRVWSLNDAELATLQSQFIITVRAAKLAELLEESDFLTWKSVEYEMHFVGTGSIRIIDDAEVHPDKMYICKLRKLQRNFAVALIAELDSKLVKNGVNNYQEYK